MHDIIDNTTTAIVSIGVVVTALGAFFLARRPKDAPSKSHEMPSPEGTVEVERIRGRVSEHEERMKNGS